jgi:hypothetical protein
MLSSETVKNGHTTPAKTARQRGQEYRFAKLRKKPHGAADFAEKQTTEPGTAL